MYRVIASALISLSLLLTSHSMAQARHGEQAAGRMVICAGEATYVIFVDAQGAPTKMPHLCPDCALHGFDALVVPPVHVGQLMVRLVVVRPRLENHVQTAQVSHALARGPPSAV